MGTTYTGLKIKNTYGAIIKVGDNSNLTAFEKQLSDGLGNNTGLYVGTNNRLGIGISPTEALHVSGNIKSTATVVATTFSGDLNGTINTATTGVTQSAGDNSTKIATTAYVDSITTAQDLDYSDGSTSSSVDLDSQTFTIAGTTNEIETSASGQTLTIGLPSTIVVNVTGNVAGDLTGNVTATSVLANGVTATTQSASDNSTKVATTAYVDSQVTSQDLDFSGTSGTGSVDLDSQTFAVIGTSNEIETSASSQTLTIGLPNDVTIGNDLTVSNDLDVTGVITTAGVTEQATQFLFTKDLRVHDAIPAITLSDSDSAGAAALGEIVWIDSGATQKAIISLTSSNLGITSKAGGLQFGTNSTNALTIDTSQNATFAAEVEFGSLTSTTAGATIGKFVTESQGIASNDNDTTVPTSAAVKDYVDTNVTAQDLDFSGTSGTGSVDLDSQTFAVVGTANEIETTAGSQQLQIGLPNDVTIGNDLTVTGDVILGATKALKFADDKIKIGDSANTPGNDGVQIGQSAHASGAEGVAIGSGYVSATATGATALGYTSDATAAGATAIGYSCSATGAGSAAFGYNIDATGGGTIAIGYSDTFSEPYTLCTDLKLLVRRGNGAKLYLQTSDTDVTDGDVLGSIQFNAPLEAGGTDAILTGAEIVAIAEGTFAADNNATELLFKVGASEAASTALTIASTKNATFAGIVETDKIFVAKGQNLAHVASSIIISQESTSKSQIRFYGADSSTAGILEFVGSTSDGSSSGARFTLNADGSSTFAGSVDIHATTGDSLLQFNVDGDTYSMGIDNSDSDKFKLSYGIFGNTDLISVETSGNTTFAGNVTVSTGLYPDADLGAELGSSSLQFSTLNTQVVKCSDNMYVSGGQFYIGALDGTTNDTFRTAVASGAYKIESRESGTWTQRLMIDTGGSATFAGDIKINNATPYLLNNDDEILAGSDTGGYYFGLVGSGNSSKGIQIGDHNSYIRFDTDGSESGRIDSSGNATFASGLTVGGGAVSSDEFTLYSGGEKSAGIWGTGSGGYGKFNLRDAGVQKVLLVGSGDSYFNGGNVGIGTTSPDLTGFGWNTLTVVGGTTAGSAGVLELGAPSTDANDQNYGIIAFMGGSTRNAQIASNRDAATNDGRLSFWTSPGSGGIEERMRISSSGNVGIGTTNDSSKFYISDANNRTQSTSQFRIEGNGYTAFHWLDATAYYINENSVYRSIRLYAGTTGGVELAAGGTSWGTFSDETEKENIKSIGNVLDKIKDYRCVKFNFKEDKSKETKIGFIAQDWENDFSEVVYKSKNKEEEEKLAMKYTETIPVLLKAIQELKAEIETLKTQINK